MAFPARCGRAATLLHPRRDFGQNLQRPGCDAQREGETEVRHGRIGEGRRSLECESILLGRTVSGNLLCTEKFFEA
jgi:hypothetical protein